ncbi:MAG: hypothetical protein E7385_02195 [Ruminococcaceae bacterium]|nr:hypothetical protein [Oscillospiraceae bacterium]
MKRSILLILLAVMMLLPITSQVQATEDSSYLINNIPEIVLPVVTQETFNDSFKVLEEAVTEASSSNPVFGFEYPFCGPGGAYGACWWQLDTSLATAGAKWTNQEFAENVLRNFMLVQREDGRIPLHGPDSLLNEDLKCSSLPKLFRTAYEILQRTEDKELIEDTYEMLKKYLDWWLTVRRHEETGLVLGIVEEFLPGSSEFTIPVETNVEVYEGCIVVSKLAEYLKKTEDYQHYKQEADTIKDAINTYIWNDAKSKYLSLKANGKHGLSVGVWSVACFDVLRHCIATEERVDILLRDLTDDSLFQWDTYPLTSAAKTDTKYNETPGAYAACQWYGSIWSLRNYSVVEGLEDIGRYDLAGYLALKTVEIFDGNYAEFLNPPDGSGHGVLRYSWTAADYIQLIVEHIFGVNYDSLTDTLTIAPILDSSLKGQTISLKNLLLPDGGTLSVTITYEEECIRISYEATGAKEFKKIIAMPSVDKEYAAVGKTVTKTTVGYSGSQYVVDNGKFSKDEIIFTAPDKVGNYEYVAPTDEPVLSENQKTEFPPVYVAVLIISGAVIFGAVAIMFSYIKKGKEE